jgi:hypothetical protein
MLPTSYAAHPKPQQRSDSPLGPSSAASILARAFAPVPATIQVPVQLQDLFLPSLPAIEKGLCDDQS